MLNWNSLFWRMFIHLWFPFISVIKSISDRNVPIDSFSCHLFGWLSCLTSCCIKSRTGLLMLVVDRRLLTSIQPPGSSHKHCTFMFCENVMTKKKQSRGKSKAFQLSQVWLWIHQCSEKWWIHALAVLSSAERSSLMCYLTGQLPAHNYLNNEPPARAA